MWDLPGPGLEPMSPELAGEFLTTAPPRKSTFYNILLICIFMDDYFKSDLDVNWHYQFESGNNDAGERHICRNNILK